MLVFAVYTYVCYNKTLSVFTTVTFTEFVLIVAGSRRENIATSYMLLDEFTASSIPFARFPYA